MDHYDLRGRGGRGRRAVSESAIATPAPAPFICPCGSAGNPRHALLDCPALGTPPPRAPDLQADRELLAHLAELPEAPTPPAGPSAAQRERERRLNESRALYDLASKIGSELATFKIERAGPHFRITVQRTHGGPLNVIRETLLATCTATLEDLDNE
jgi:hypothetical protein